MTANAVTMEAYAVCHNTVLAIRQRGHIFVGREAVSDGEGLVVRPKLRAGRRGRKHGLWVCRVAVHRQAVSVGICGDGDGHVDVVRRQRGRSSACGSSSNGIVVPSDPLGQPFGDSVEEVAVDGPGRFPAGPGTAPVVVLTLELSP